MRYDVYGLDYGCYVELTATAKAPQGLFEAEVDDGTVRYVEVPEDDYRSIRRAILDVSEFDRTQPEAQTREAGQAGERAEVSSKDP